jgi:hypothetical protein
MRLKEKLRKEKNEFDYFKPVEVTTEECDGDYSKMIKRFVKKTRKEQILKPFYDRLLYWETKGQKERKKKQKGIYEWQKTQKKMNQDEED